jgi:hypothetical protein
MTILLYKAAIRQLCGDELLPLNTIRDRYPDLYDRESAKYAERPHVMDHPVHPLGCRWTDVVFFSPVHPELIFEALRESGRISAAPGLLDHRREPPPPRPHLHPAQAARSAIQAAAGRGLSPLHA